VLEAQWVVEFKSAIDFGAGTVVFESGRVFGGDGQYRYEGDYKIDNGHLTGEVEVERFSGAPNSVFGPLDRFKIKVSGRVQSPVMDLYGNLAQSPFTPIVIRCTKKSDLP
jgi:hypothetical protein